MKYPDRKAFREVCKAYAANEHALTFTDIGSVFGPEFYELLLYSLMDAGDAARAIAGAVSRLKAGDKAEA